MKPIPVKLSTPPQSSFKYKLIETEAFEFNWHCHPELEIMLMLDSKGKRFVGDNIYYYSEGDLVFVGSNLPHTLYSAAGTMGRNKKHRAILIQFERELAGLQISEAPELKTLDRLFDEAACGLRFHGKPRDLAAQKMQEMEHLHGFDRLLQLLAILNCLSHADDTEKELLSSVEFNNSLKPGHQSRIDQVCTYLNENYRYDLRLEDVAAIANMSVTAFSRFFKRSTGKTFVRYVNELRIGHACRLLIESEATISEICYAVGFNNVSNFNRRFSERHKMSPRQYRDEFALRV